MFQKFIYRGLKLHIASISLIVAIALQSAKGSSGDPVAEVNQPMRAELDARSAVQMLASQAALTTLDIPEISSLLKPSLSSNFQSTLDRQREFIAAFPSIMPADGWLSSGFGNRKDPVTGRQASHKGLDISNAVGTPIFATADGIVRYAKPYGHFGNYISIVHGFGILTKYAHLDQVRVKAGQTVKRGQLIGMMGDSGKSTGSHLHFEIWVNDHAFNPIAFMPKVLREDALPKFARPDLVYIALEP